MPIKKFLRIFGLVVIVISLTFLLHLIANLIVEQVGFSEGHSPFSLDELVEKVALSLFGAILCSWVGHKMGLTHWRFFLCGFILWNFTLPLLVIYPFLRTEKKESYYNYYALSLGGMFFVLWLSYLSLALFFHDKGV